MKKGFLAITRRDDTFEKLCAHVAGNAEYNLSAKLKKRGGGNP